MSKANEVSKAVAGITIILVVSVLLKKELRFTKPFAVNVPH